MKIGKLVISSFIASIFITISASIMTLLHYQGADEMLIAAVVTTIVFIIAAIVEVTQSDRITSNQKTLWTIALIFFSGIAGLIYVVAGRKKITPNK
ncbi:MAG: PLDc N-terminal domain-containing protein [Ferruginibacter sp.]